MKKAILSVLILLSAGAHAHKELNIMDEKNNVLLANGKIKWIYQTQASEPLQLTIITTKEVACTVYVLTQLEANSLVAAVNSGADVDCHNVRKTSDPSTYITKKYTIGTFLLPK